MTDFVDTSGPLSPDEIEALADGLEEACKQLRKARHALEHFGGMLHLDSKARAPYEAEVAFTEALISTLTEEAADLPDDQRTGRLNGLAIQGRHLLNDDQTGDEKKTLTVDDWAPTVRSLLNRGPIPPVQWLIESLLPTGGLLAVQGAYKSGKTELLLELAVAIATGEPCFDLLPVGTQGPVLLALEESMEVDTSRRADQLVRGRNLNRDDDRLDLVRASSNSGIKLTDPEWMKRITEQAQTMGAVLVIFDPLVRVKGADANENQQAEMAPALQALVDLRRATGATVGFTHHVGHGETHRMRGSSDFEAWWSTKIVVESKGKTDAEKMRNPRTITALHREAPPFAGVDVRRVWDHHTDSAKFVPVGGVVSEAIREQEDIDHRSRQAIIAAVTAHPGNSKNGIVEHDLVPGNAQKIRGLVDQLVNEGLIDRRRNGQAQEHFPPGQTTLTTASSTTGRGENQQEAPKPTTEPNSTASSTTGRGTDAGRGHRRTTASGAGSPVGGAPGRGASGENGKRDTDTLVNRLKTAFDATEESVP